MRRVTAFLLACSIACGARADDQTPDLVLTEDKLAPSPDAPPVVRIETDDQPDLAFADATDPNPGSGSGQIVAGWIATGIGIAGIAQGSTCGLEINDFSVGQQRRCRNVGITFAVIGLGLGIPWLVFGYEKRSALREWKKRHGLTALPELRFAGDSLLVRF